MSTNDVPRNASRLLPILTLALCGLGVSATALAGPPTVRDHRTGAPSTGTTTHSRPPSSPPPRAQDVKNKPPTGPVVTGPCASERRKGQDAIVRDHRNITLECKLADATHNLEVANRLLAKATTTKDRARWEDGRTFWDLEVTKAQIELAKRDLPKASGWQKVALERQLNDGISKLEARADEIDALVRARTEDAKAKAEDRVRALKRDYERATGQAKAEAEKAYKGAMRTLKGFEKRLIDQELAKAQRKVDAAKAHVGKEAAKLRAEAEKQYASAKKQYDAAATKLKNEVAKLEKSLKDLEKKLGAYTDKAEKALDDAVGELDDLADDLSDALGSLL